VNFTNTLKAMAEIQEKKDQEKKKPAPILDGTGFSEFWKTKCPALPWFKAMQKFHAKKKKESK